MRSDEELWILVKLASEADIRGTATPAEIQLLAEYPDLHLSVLKTQKANVEYQFVSHKQIMTDMYSKLLNKKLTLAEYTDQRKEQYLWKTKAISYLIRIEEKMSHLKMSQKRTIRGQIRDISTTDT